MKRAFDVVASLLGLIVLSPIFLAIAVTTLLMEGLPLLFTQKRTGRYGKEFNLYKFRSMRVSQKGKTGPLITARGDSRITVIGSFLRKTKLDELPQLWNVLRGDMSLVGPRPEVLRYTELYHEEQREILNFRPGITDPASLELYDEESILAAVDDAESHYRSVLLPQKNRISLAYAKQATLWSDLLIIGKTVSRVFVKQNAVITKDEDQSIKRSNCANRNAA